MKKTILILGIGCVSIKYLSAALASHDMKPVVLSGPGTFSNPVRELTRDVELHELDVDSFEAIVSFLDTHPELTASVIAITGLFDEKYPLIERVAHRYGWSCPGPVICRLSDKAVVHALISEFSPHSIAFTQRELGTLTPEKLAMLGQRLVLKPAVASGGSGVVHMENDADALNRIRNEVTHATPVGADADAWVVQQALDGRLISCEGFVQHHAIRYLGLSVRSRIDLTEVANQFPADRHWPLALADCRACIDALVERSGLDNCYFHCEFILSGDHAYLIDANVGRLGGASILEQISLAHCCAPEDVLRHVLLLPILPLDEATTPRYRPVETCEETLGIWYGIPLTATVERVDAPASDRVRHTQFAAEGACVQRVGASDYSWVGMMSGPRASVQTEIGRVRIATDAGDCLPAFVID